MKALKFGIRCIYIFLCVIIILDFIPVKFAKNKNLVKYKQNTYICTYCQVTGGNYCATIDNNPLLEKPIYFEIIDYPFNILKNDRYRKEYEEPTGIQYVLCGKVTTISNENSEIDIENWSMVYPIMRPSFRVIYAPRAYLTVYDFDWLEILRRIVN